MKGSEMSDPATKAAKAASLTSDEDFEEVELDESGASPALEGVRAPDWSVQVFKAERTVFELHRRWKQGRLVLDPGFQRDDVWDSGRKVRLIESVLAKVPLPAIYLSEERESRMLVVDGKQRLTTLFTFLDGGFELRGLKLLPQFDGMRFTALEELYRRRIEDTPLTVFSIQPGSDEQVKYHLFERLNQGGVPLYPQEIRNGLYRGPGLDRVEVLGRVGGLFRHVAGEARRYTHKKADELVLRCFAFLLRPLDAYPGDMGMFLNDALLQMNRMSSQELDSLQVRLERSLSVCSEVFGKAAFVRYEPEWGGWGSHLNPAVMDAQVRGFDRVASGSVPWSERRDAVVGAFIELHRRRPFLDSVLYATSVTSRVEYRVGAWERVLRDVAST